MFRYYVQHGAGLSELLIPALTQVAGNIRISFQDESALVFDSNIKPQILAGLPFIKNAFVVLAESRSKNISRAVHDFEQGVNSPGRIAFPAKVKQFRVMAHVDGSLVSMPSRARSDLEKLISSQTGGG